MTLFLSIVIFVLSVALFFLTWNKVRNIKKDILIEDVKKELEGLLGEFNSAAARNIELLEAKIGELQDVLKKANTKMTELDGRIDRANRPIVIERIIPGSAPAPSAPAARQAPARQAAAVQNQPAPAAREKTVAEEAKNVRKRLEEAKKAVSKPVVKESEQPRKQEPEAVPAPDAATDESASRSDQLKKHLRAGRSRDELLALGFQENEINLVSFFLRKQG